MRKKDLTRKIITLVIISFILTFSFSCVTKRIFVKSLIDGYRKSAISKGLITKYPIILVHGFCGFDEMGGIEYFYGVKDYLTNMGFEVYSPELPAVGSIKDRATKLKEYINEKVPIGKVNLIAHSMGGLDSRYMITHLNMKNRVASLTTISTPHRGTPVADVALGLMVGPTDKILDYLLNRVGLTLDGVKNLTEDYVQNTFNPSTPDVEGVKYYSYAGVSGIGEKDLLKAALDIPYGIILAIRGRNDGMVPLSSAKWGEFKGEIPADHADEICQWAGETGTFDCKGFYLSIAQDLIKEGF